MKQQRLFYLDNLRGFAMLFGVFVHTCTLADFGHLDVIRLISGNFRMGTFFAVSGFFGALLLSNREVSMFLEQRVLAVGLPLLAGLLLLNPLTLWLVFLVHNGPAHLSLLPDVLVASFRGGHDFAGRLVWHLHLWFLISLLFHTVTAPWVLRLLDAVRAQVDLRRALGHIPDWLQPLAVALAVTVSVLGIRAFFSITLKPLDTPWLVRATLSYWPYYILGMVLFRERALLSLVHRVDLPLIFVAGSFWFMSMQVNGGGTLSEVVNLFRRELTVCAAFFALLWLFRAVFDSSHSLARRLVGSVYTIYLFHYLVIYALGLVVIPMTPPGSVELFLIVSGGTFALTFSLHVLVAERSKLFRLVFNGRRGLAAPA